MPVTTAIERIEEMLPTLSKPQPAWRVHIERLVAVILLIAAYWPTLRRLHHRLRATLRAGF
jgi:hypothetical protein